MTTNGAALLRERASAIYNAALSRAQEQQKSWVQTEKPQLKQYGKGLKETLAIQHASVQAQQERVARLSAHPDDPAKVHTGFNVIRARVTSEGKPYSTQDLQAERDRLARALNQLAIDIAAAKAEIQSQRRAAEVEIWETQLVALQDTARVYRQEINIIEVELLGREQQARIERDRAAAEASGLAQLQRLEEQATQTRVRLNRARQQYHFPPPQGYNITFGGGGIYGALKDITFCEVHGNLSITATVLPGGKSSSSGGASGNSTGGASRTGAPNSSGGSPISDSGPRARLVILFDAPKSALGNLGGASAAGRQQAAGQQGSPTKGAQAAAAAGVPAANGTSVQDRGAAKATASSSGRRDSIGSASATPAHRPSLSRLSAASGSTRAAPGTAASSLAPAEMAAAAATGQPQQQPLPTFLQPPVPRKPSKAKAMAVRFLNKIGSKKDKYQGKEQAQLQPSTDPGNKRTLAGKLLGRKSRPEAGSPRVSGELDMLSSFHSQHLETATNSGLSVDEGPHPPGSYTESLGLGAVDELSDEEEGGAPSSPGHFLASASQPNLAYADEGGQTVSSPLTREALRHAEAAAAAAELEGDSSSSSSDSASMMASSNASPDVRQLGLEGRGTWLRGRGSSMVEAPSTWGGASSMDGASDMGAADGGAEGAAAAAAGAQPQGVHVVGRVTGFGLVGERGSKVPNLSLAQGDVEGNVLVRFVFEYTKLGGWQPADKPVFDVTRLHTRLKGNNVPMPDSLIKTILRLAIPGLIQRKLLGALPRELGSYLLQAGQGFHINADVALVATPLSVLDADLAFEVKGPAKSAAEAKKEQHKYAAAKEARRLLGLSLPQAQVLSDLFRKGGLLELGQHPISIFQLIALQRTFDAQPQLYHQLCQVLNTGYQLRAEQVRCDLGEFDFRELMDGPISRMRRKPAKMRVVCHRVELPISLDALLTAVRDYFQRSLEELLIKGPLPNPRDNPEAYEEEPPLEEQVELLHAWHAWMLQELSHFKSKFGGAGGTLLGAASSRGFSAGVENLYYEGPLRVRVPVSMQLDADGAFSFDVPLPSAEGAIGEFVDGLKSRLVPAHLRPPPAAINWIPNTGDTELDARMRAQVARALEMVGEVLRELNAKVALKGAAKMDEDPVTALAQPRTAVGDRLGRMIVNRLRVHVRLDERRISEILQGIDSRSMGAGFVATAGRILGHLGDVMTLGFTPAAPAAGPLAGPQQGGSSSGGSGSGGAQRPPQQYLFVFESSDISRLRADVQSLGFQSLITPGGAVRLVHAAIRAFLAAFKRAPEAVLRALDERFQAWYQHMTREGLDMSLCLDLRGVVAGNACVVTLNGTADETALRETSPFVAVNDLELLPAAVALFGPGAAAAAAAAAASGGAK